MELFLKTFTNNNADTYKSYIRRTCTPKPWPPFGHLFEELFSIGARIRYVKNINAYNNKQLLISRGAWGVPVPGTKERSKNASLSFYVSSTALACLAVASRRSATAQIEIPWVYVFNKPRYMFSIC